MDKEPGRLVIFNETDMLEPNNVGVSGTESLSLREVQTDVKCCLQFIDEHSSDSVSGMELRPPSRNNEHSRLCVGPMRS